MKGVIVTTQQEGDSLVEGLSQDLLLINELTTIFLNISHTLTSSITEPVTVSPLHAKINPKLEKFVNFYTLQVSTKAF